MSVLRVQPTGIPNGRPGRIYLHVSNEDIGMTNLVDYSLAEDPQFCTHHCTSHGWRSMSIDSPCPHMWVAQHYMKRLKAHNQIIYTGIELTPAWVARYLDGRPYNQVIARRRCTDECPVAMMLTAMTGEEASVRHDGIYMYRYPNKFELTSFIYHIVSYMDSHDGGMAAPPNPYDTAWGQAYGINIMYSATGQLVGTLDVTVADMQLCLKWWTDKYGNNIEI